jgi:hypothetical protein
VVRSENQLLGEKTHQGVLCCVVVETCHMRRKSRPQSAPAEWHGNVPYATVAFHAHEIHHPLHSQRSNPLHTPPPLECETHKKTRKRIKNLSGSARAQGMSGRCRGHLEAKVVLWWCSVVANRYTPRIVNIQTSTLPPPRKSCVVVVLCCVVLWCCVVLL